MKNTKTSKSYTIAIAASLLLTPLGFSGEEHGEHPDKESKQYSAHVSEYVKIGHENVEANQLKGTPVVNRNGERLGEVEDLVYKSSSEMPTHLIVSTDNWFDGRSAIIPMSAVDYKKSDAKNALEEMIDGDQIILDLNEEEFDAIATFNRGNDLQKHLQSHHRTIANTFDANDREIFDSNDRYTTRFVSRDGHNNKTAYSETQEKMRYRSADEREEWGQKTVQIDGHKMMAKDVKGIEVVNYDDDDLGKVVDIVLNSDKDEAEYLVVRTDNWFDGKYAVVPLSSISYHENTKDPHPKDGANWWDGEHIVLNISESDFDEMADYDMKDGEFDSYLEENRDSISRSYSNVWSDYPAVASSYVFIYSIPVQPAPMSSRSANEMANSENKRQSERNLSIDGKNVQLNSIKGREIQLSDANGHAKVADVVINQKTGEAKYLAVCHESWKKDQMTLVPVEAVSYPMSDDTMKSSSAIKVELKDRELKRMATFDTKTDLSKFLKSNARQIARTFEVNESEIKRDEAVYIMASEDTRFQTASIR